VYLSISSHGRATEYLEDHDTDGLVVLDIKNDHAYRYNDVISSYLQPVVDVKVFN
jgi:hypothetical protein